MVLIGKILLLFLIWEVFASSSTSTKKSLSLKATTKKSLTSSTRKPSTTTRKIVQSTSKSILTTKKSSKSATTSKKPQRVSTKKALGTTKNSLKVTTEKPSTKALKTTKNARHGPSKKYIRTSGTTNKARSRTTTKSLPIFKPSNDTWKQIYKNLHAQESQIAEMMQKEIIQLQIIQKNVASIPTFSSIVDDTIKLFTNSMTTANFPIYQNQSSKESVSCNGVDTKLITMQNEIQRLVTVHSCASINSSYLEEQVNLMKESSVKYRDLIPSSVDFQSLVQNGLTIVHEMLNYSSMLKVAVEEQTKLFFELNAYKNRYCSSNKTSSPPDLANISSSKDNSKCCASGGSGKWCCLNSADNSDCSIPAPCGSLLDLMSNDPFDSRTLGFNSGKFIDGSTVFPGTGIFSKCFGVTAARITTSKADKGMGAYTVCYDDPNKVHRQNNITAKYFLDHPDLKWVKTNPLNASRHSRAIKVTNSRPEIRLVGRYNFSMKNQNYSQIGYYISERGVSIYWNGRANVETEEDFEVLTCDECTNGGSGLYCCMNGAENPSCCLNGGAGQFCCKNGANNPECSLPLRCGSLLDLKSNNPLNNSTLGFNLGTTDDGSILFPGTGYNSDCYGENPATIALFPNSPGSGAYMKCRDDDFVTFDNSSAKYFYAHSQLKWVTTTPIQASRVPRRLIVTDLIGYEKLVAKMDLTLNGNISLQINEFIAYDEDYYDEFGESFDILACGECTNGGVGSFCCLNGEENVDYCPEGGSGRWCCKNGQDNPACAMPPKCGSLLSLKSNDPSNPLTPGFKSGTFVDGSEIYPGIGTFDCGDNIPARISISDANIGSAAFSTCLNEVLIDNSDGMYFSDHPQLKWVSTSPKDLSRVLRKIEVPNNDFETPFYVGRYNFTMGKEHFSQIGYFSKRKGFFYYFNGKNAIKSAGSFEVLTCDECTNGGSGFFCCRNGATFEDCCTEGFGQYCCLNGADNPECLLPLTKCGSLLNLKSNDPFDPKTPGLKSGTFIDGSTVFPGIGYFGQCDGYYGNIARISASNTSLGSGAFTLCLSDVENPINLFDGFNGQYFYAHPRLKWVKTSLRSVYQLEGKVDLVDMIIARFNFTVGNKSYSQITYFGEYDEMADYWNGAKVVTTFKNFDVLVCKEEK